ncbi:hypothetical protein OG863_09850 [Streptomyces decoyicus]|uniref:Uncharacterized protein n=1 Tax=Streptomyces decoyicus TaxID=249567 RepID=A0ABZ1FU16_9ACTN|nr:hypothetical protein OG863_09850 [Streptomyces decoyicus]
MVDPGVVLVRRWCLEPDDE